MSGIFSSAAAINGAIADWKISQFMSTSDMFLSADGLTDCMKKALKDEWGTHGPIAFNV